METLKPLYKKDLNFNYMILPCLELGEEDYQVQMMIKNKIPGILSASTRIVDGRLSLYYEISGKQTVEKFYQHREMGWEDIQGILLTIAKVEKSCSLYLLDAGKVLWEPEYLYIDYEHEQIEVSFYPEYNGDWLKNIGHLASYILQRTNHKDEKAVMLSYQFYKNTREDNFSIENLLENMSKIYAAAAELTVEQERDDGNGNAVYQEERKPESAAIRGRRKRDTDSSQNQEKNTALKSFEKQENNPGKRERHKAGGKEYNNRETKGKRVFLNIILTIVTCLLSIGVVVYFRFFSYVMLDSRIELVLIGAVSVLMVLLVLQLMGKRQVDNTETSLSGIDCNRDAKKTESKIEGKEERGKKEEEKITSLHLLTEYQMFCKEAESGQMVSQKTGIEDEQRTNRQEVKDGSQKLAEDTSPNMVLYDFLKDERSQDMGGYSIQKAEHGTTEIIPRTTAVKKPVLEGILQKEQKRFSIAALPWVIGKMKGCVDLALEDASISRMHARIFEKEGKICLEDLHSTNGTFHNGILLKAEKEVALEDGDIIRFAEVEFTYHE